jgi:hypothetical protein
VREKKYKLFHVGRRLRNFLNESFILEWLFNYSLSYSSKSFVLETFKKDQKSEIHR